MSLVENFVYRPDVIARKFRAYPADKQTPDVIDLASKLCIELGEVRGRSRIPLKASLKAASHFVGNYLRALDRYPEAPHHYHFHYPRNEARLREDVTGFTPKIVGMIELMNSRGLVLDRPVQPSSQPTGRESTFHFTPEFHALMQRGMHERGQSKGRRRKACFIPVLYSEPFLLYRDNRLGMTAEAIRKARSLPVGLDKPSKRRMHRTLTRYNELLAKTTLDFDYKAAQESLGAGLPDFDRDALSEPVSVYRLFADKEIKTHGRLYGGPWMRMPSKLRSFLTINGQPTIELDFQGMQPNLLFSLVGDRPPNKDPYEISSSDESSFVYPDRYRKLAKEAFMYLFNSRISPNRFVKQISADKVRKVREALGDSSEYTIDEDIRANAELLDLYNLFNDEGFKEALYQDIKETWKAIWSFFEDNTYNWRQVTKLESDIALEVIRSMTALGIPVLTIHDSFITVEGYALRLEQAMKDAYKKVMRVDDTYVPLIRKH